MMAPQPLGIEGVAVDVEAAAADKLRGMGIEPADLGTSFVTLDEIEAIQVKRDVGSILEWQHINGLRVVRMENVTSDGSGGGSDFRGICISLSRARDSARSAATCALPVLDGIPIDNERLGYLDPESVAAMAVLQPIDARILYGKRGDDGAVLIWTKGRR